MPPKRSKLMDDLVRIPRLGRYVKTGHDAWLRFNFNRSWQSENRAAKNAFEADKPQLTQVQLRVLSELNSRGIAHVHFDELIGDPQLWGCLSVSVGRWLESEEVKQGERAYLEGDHRLQAWKEYILRLYGNQSTISWDSAWLRLALRPQILNLVNSYLGLMSKLIYVDIWNTLPLAESHRPTGSQRWHRDPEDIKLVKVFLYLTDVDSTAGPLHYVPNSRRGEKYGGLWPQKIPSGSVPPAGALEETIPRSDWEIAAHRAGTFVFVDTTGFHMGGRATVRHRVMATWSFVSPASLWPRVFQLASGETPPELSLAAAFALS